MSRYATDPSIPFRYFVELDHVASIRCTELSGLKVSTSTKSLYEGGNNAHEVHMVEKAKYDDLVLKKGFYAQTGLFAAWVRALHQVTVPIIRHEMSVVMLDNDFSEIGRFNLHKAFPIAYEGPAPNSTSKDIAFETITFKYDYFTYEPGNQPVITAAQGLMAMS